MPKRAMGYTMSSSYKRQRTGARSSRRIQRKYAVTLQRKRGMNYGVSLYNPVRGGNDNYINVKCQRVVQMVTNTTTMPDGIQLTVRW